MKKKLLCELSVAALMGCQKEIEAPQASVGVPSDYVASIEVPTKTSLDELAVVLWTKDDRVSVFDHTTLNVQYKIADAGAGKSNAALEGITSNAGASKTKLSANVAYYPYTYNNVVKQNEDGYTLTVKLPSERTYVANSFGVGASPMVAVTEDQADKALSFKNVCGVLELQLTGSGIVSEIVLQGNNGEILSGAATVSVKNGENPTIALSGTGTVLTLDCGVSGVQLSSDRPTPFSIVVPPMTFRLHCYDPSHG